MTTITLSKPSAREARYGARLPPEQSWGILLLTP